MPWRKLLICDRLRRAGTPSLAQEPPKENAQACLRLMGMALKNLASAMNNTQALEAAALILGSDPTPTAMVEDPPLAIAYRAEQLEMLGSGARV
ncbi:hypothetical protein [Nostoc sp. C057]|uniref:hypothetical protein n=1 Tax=Nostoc sp. C057 TaxID=2576903 RepID=UPI002118BFED|nr:hypothetical protein [Nostoc sp. C057]